VHELGLVGVADETALGQHLLHDRVDRAEELAPGDEDPDLIDVLEGAARVLAHPLDVGERLARLLLDGGRELALLDGAGLVREGGGARDEEPGPELPRALEMADRGGEGLRVEDGLLHERSSMTAKASTSTRKSTCERR